MSSNSILSLLSFNTLIPGTYHYYAQTTIAGVHSATRTMATVTVMQNPAGISVTSNSVYPGHPKTFTAINHQSGDLYVYDFGDGATLPTTNSSAEHTYAAFGQYQVNVVSTGSNGCSKTSVLSINVKDFEPLCSASIPMSGSGEFKWDKHSGQIVFVGANCVQPYVASCIEGKVEAPALNNVVAASAITFSDNWKYATDGTPPPGVSLYELGNKGMWRPAQSFAFNTNIDYQANSKNTIAGRYTLSNFSWQSPMANTRTGWLLINSVEAYSANGDPVQERNALNIASAAKFGYGGSVPYLIAQNADYESVMFEGFEGVSSINGIVTLKLEEGAAHSGNSISTVAHSGKYSIPFTGFNSRVFNSKGKALQVRFWAKGDASLSSANFRLYGSTVPITQVNQIAQSGEWSLWEAVLNSPSTAEMVYLFKIGVGTILMDDLRIQPVDAEMTCYVYDPKTLRLLTVFDDQHFGLYYQYNDEGKLVRKQIETKRGIRTIQETQYNIPTTNTGGGQ